MKKYLLLFFLFAFTGCSKNLIQLIGTSSNNCVESAGCWVFENDTIKITYDLWAENGLMAFNIYNKLEKPIYIDWKNSSFILEGNKLDYWIDEQQTNVESYYKGYYYSGPLYGVNKGVVITSANAVKPERITFIPPKSNYPRKQFYLLPFSCFELNPNCKVSIEKRNDKPRKSTSIKYQTFDEIKSPFKVRNYIAIAFSETSNEYVFIDNDFYMTSLKEMDRRHFLGKRIGWDEYGLAIYKTPFKIGTSFYIILQPKINEYTSSF